MDEMIDIAAQRAVDTARREPGFVRPLEAELAVPASVRAALLTRKDNPTEFLPIEHKVLVKPIEIEKVTKGGIILADITADSEKFKQTKGLVIAVSGLAFNYADPDEYEALGGIKPKAGDTVLYAKFAGAWVKSERDGQEYLMLNDKDIISIVTD
jgi:co-chaperonin GroES (HSP10)